MSVNETDNRANLRRSKRLNVSEESPTVVARKSRKTKSEAACESVIDSVIESVTNSDNKLSESNNCETCGNKYTKKSDSKDNNCSPCKKTEKELSDEYVEECNKTCENCKETSLSSENRMIGCLICMRYYHVSCLLESDLPHDLKFEPNQLIRRKLGCVRCSVVHLCYKVSSVVSWRWRPAAAAVSNPERYYMPREFFVFYSKMSYWDCEWVSELQMEVSEINIYRSYKRRCVNYSIPPALNPLSGSHKRKMSQSEIELYEKYFQWGIDPEWLQPHKVIGLDNVGCFVKWRGLGYEYVSTEPLTRVDMIPGLSEAIERHKKLIKEVTGRSWQTKNKLKLTKLAESPDYLGPKLNNNNDNKASLHPYQLEGVNWLRSCYSNNINTILADEMGLGKTIQAIALLYSLYKDNVSRGPFLITVPLSTMKNWEREFEFWAPDFCVVSYYGDKDTRSIIRDKDLYYESKKKTSVMFHVLLTTYELIHMDESFLSHINWEILIVDEAHRLKNNDSKLFKSLKKYNIEYRILMTGTPLQNNLEELFHLLNFMEPESFGDITAFLSQFQDVSKEEQVHTLQEMLKKHILRRLKIDVFVDLPTKEEQIVRVELTSLQKTLYKIILSKNYESLSGRFSGVKMSNIMMQLRKCCNHPYLLSSDIADDNLQEDGSYNASAVIAASGKMIILQKMLIHLRKTGHKVLIFSGMTKLLDLLEYMLEEMDIQFERIDGNVSSVSRQNAIDRFNDPQSVSMVFLLSTKAGGLGINLSSADTVFIYDSDWNPQNDIQALSRAHRIGQTKKVMIYRFVTRNSVEEKVMETAKRKLMVTNLVVKSFTKTEFHQILSFGTKELFEENDDKNDQKIIYDDAAIEQLLDRNRVEVQNPENSLLDSCFSGFKMAQYQFANDIEDKEESKEKIDEIKDESLIENPASYWSTLLEPFVKSTITEDSIKEPELGKGLRHKKKINYEFEENVNQDKSPNNSQKVSNDKDPDDTDYDISEGEYMEPSSSVDQKSEDSYEIEKKPNGIGVDNGKFVSKFNFDRDFKDLANHGVNMDSITAIGSSHITESNVLKYKYFSVIDGFTPKERMEIYNSLMNYGLPPKSPKKSDSWWPSTLEHKTSDEMERYMITLMFSLSESADANYNKNDDPILKDDIDFDLLLARIGLNGLINFKVNQFETVNRTTLEMVTYKHWNVRSIPTEELEKLFDELKYFEFEFDIFDGGFSQLHSEWDSSKQTTNKEPQNPTLHWNKFHDYYLLSAIACHGYDRFIDMIFQDPQYQVLFIPARMDNLDITKDNSEIRKSIRNRQKILENALLLEAQMTKIGSIFDGYTMDYFSNERLRHYHEMFVKHGTSIATSPLVVNSRNRVAAIAQLELLINDIESNSDSFIPVTLKLISNTE